MLLLHVRRDVSLAYRCRLQIPIPINSFISVVSKRAMKISIITEKRSTPIGTPFRYRYILLSKLRWFGWEKDKKVPSWSLRSYLTTSERSRSLFTSYTYGRIAFCSTVNCPTARLQRDIRGAGERIKTMNHRYTSRGQINVELKTIWIFVHNSCPQRSLLSLFSDDCVWIPILFVRCTH